MSRNDNCPACRAKRAADAELIERIGQHAFDEMQARHAAEKAFHLDDDCPACRAKREIDVDSAPIRL